jgi:DNA-directed RNA polymerase subunit beta'
MAFWPGTVDIVEVASASGAKKFDVYVRPTGEAAEKEAEALALQYSFSRTTSKTFKKLSPYTPITSVTSPDDLLVEKGDAVKAGDYLVDGTPIPHEVLMVKGSREAAARRQPALHPADSVECECRYPGHHDLRQQVRFPLQSRQPEPGTDHQF